MIDENYTLDRQTDRQTDAESFALIPGELIG